MNWTVQQKIRVGFWLLAFVPIILGVLAARNARELVEAAQDLARANETSQVVEKLSSDIKDLEVAQREYILIGSPAAINAFNRAKTEIDGDVRRLFSLRRANNPKDKDIWMAQLETLVPEKLAEIRATFRMRDEQGPDAAAWQLMLTSRGSQAMDSIRTVLRNLRTEEGRLLQARRDEQSSRFFATLQLFAVVLLVNVALLAMLYFLQRRETERSREAQQELERRVALRTEELQRSNEDLQQFAYVASHDLKEPLRMISSYTTLLQRRYMGRLDDDADVFLNFVVDGVRRMNDLIQDLLEYSRAGSGKDEKVANVDVEEVLQNVIANLKVTIAEAGANVRWERLPRTVPYDQVRLAQIFQNLIGNAIKYRGSREPEVVISSITRGKEAVFTVEDNGIGIEAEYTDKIFGIFQRLHGKEYEGTGIGLAMVKKIVERNGGRIWVESTPGTGSRFSFSVPMNAPLSKSAAVSSSTS